MPELRLYATIESMVNCWRLWLLTLFLTPLTSQALCVKADQANLRRKPSSKAPLAWTVGKYMPLLEVGRKGPWVHVRDFEGKKMWIYYSLVTDRIDCAVIKVGKSMLRSGPGTKFKPTPLRLAYRYMPFKKLDRNEGWLKLQDDYGFRHWVHENNLWEPLNYSTINYQ